MSEPSLYQPLGNHLAVARNGTTQSQVQFSTEYPVTRIETIADGTINFGKVGYLAVPADGYELQPGDILYSHINSIKHVGKVAQHFGEEKTLYHGMNLLLLRLDDEVDNRYFFHYLNSYNARHYAQKECQKAINQVSLNTGQLKKLPVFTPPLNEQRLIAQILDTLDTQTQKTEALIAKLEKVKEGLLHDLLTRGIDENGRLRPSPVQAPELYKQTEAGLIPLAWEACTLGDLASFNNGNSFKASDWKQDGYPIIRIQNNGGESFNYYQGPLSDSWHVLTGDLLFAWSGQRGVSFGARIWKGPEGVLNQHIFKVVRHEDLITQNFLYTVLRFKQAEIEDSAHGFKSSFLHVTRGELSRVPAGIPPKME